jgi:hypothetical protein
MKLFKQLLLLMFACLFFMTCKKESKTTPDVDLNSFSGSYNVSGTHYNWYYYFGPGVQPYDSIIHHLYNHSGDSLVFSRINDTMFSASLYDSGVAIPVSLLYTGYSAAGGGYVFTAGQIGSPDLDSLMIYNGSRDSVYLFFTANLPHSGGDTYQMWGSKK